MQEGHFLTGPWGSDVRVPHIRQDGAILTHDTNAQLVGTALDPERQHARGRSEGGGGK